jgi:hypothetical protein
MPTLSQVITTFQNDKIIHLVSAFYDIARAQKRSGTGNHFGTDNFCQFVKYAQVSEEIVKTGISFPNMKITTIKGSLGKDVVSITEYVEIPGLLASTSGGYSMEVSFNDQEVCSFAVNSNDHLLSLKSYKKGDWIDRLRNEIAEHSKSKKNISIEPNSLDEEADPNCYRI